jgi:hypothetical protein
MLGAGLILLGLALKFGFITNWRITAAFVLAAGMVLYAEGWTYWYCYWFKPTGTVEDFNRDEPRAN